MKEFLRRISNWLLAYIDECPACGKSWKQHQCAAAPQGRDQCAICLRWLPVGTARTHEGKWRCASHKGVA